MLSGIDVVAYPQSHLLRLPLFYFDIFQDRVGISHQTKRSGFQTIAVLAFLIPVSAILVA